MNRILAGPQSSFDRHVVMEVPKADQEVENEVNSLPDTVETRTRFNRPKLTRVEILVIMSIGIILSVVLVSGIQRARETARREACSNNIRQVGLGVLNYESSYKRLPFGWGGAAKVGGYTEDVDWLVGRVAIGRLSGLVSIIPQLESSTLFSEIQTHAIKTRDGRIHQYPDPVAPWDMKDGNFTPWRTQMSLFRCPSDPGRINPDASWEFDGCARTNYVFCYGDTIRDNNNGWHPASNRGAFQGRHQRRLTELTDGTSNTLILGEIGTSSSQNLIDGKGKVRVQGSLAKNIDSMDKVPFNCMKVANADRYLPSFLNATGHWRGIRWADGATAFGCFTTVLPPNSASCSPDNWDNQWGIYSASGYHVGGVHVVFADLKTQFISNSIDAGNLNSPGPSGNDGEGSAHKSPFGVWGSMGSKDAGDTMQPL
jgi:hypothetical protein